MDKLVISGGHKLKGTVSISGAKNAAVAILPAAILSDGVCRIENIPAISDITLMCRILRDMGANIKMINKGRLFILRPLHLLQLQQDLHQAICLIDCDHHFLPCAYPL